MVVKQEGVGNVEAVGGSNQQQGGGEAAGWGAGGDTGFGTLRDGRELVGGVWSSLLVGAA